MTISVEQSSAVLQKKLKPLIIPKFVLCLSLFIYMPSVMINFKIHWGKTWAKIEPRNDINIACTGMDLNYALY